MKKYKQLYKYSDCVITNLHVIQLLYSHRYNASHPMEDKKRLVSFSGHFFCTRHVVMETAVMR